MTLLEEFIETFKGNLEQSVRWDAFIYIADELTAKNRPVHIIETGCARKQDNWYGDGQSTQLWDWVIGKVGGTGVSFDISEESVTYARSVVKNINIVQSDSVIGLRTHDASSADLLYLDSYDLTDGIESPLHHLAELSSVYASLPSGCLIVVDDCISDNHGKHRMVKGFLESLGVHEVFSGYVTIWRKP